VVVAPWAERLGGAENMLWTLLKHVDRGRVKLVVVFLEPGLFADEVRQLGLHAEVLSADRLRNVRSYVRAVRVLAAILRRERPDLLLNWFPKTQLYGAPAAVLAGMGERVVWWQHGIPKGHWLDRLATLLPTRAIGCSSRHSAEAQARLWPHRQTLVVCPGVELVDPPGPEEVAQVRSQLGVPSGRPVVGIVGRLQPWKRQHHLIRALAELRNEGIDAHGLIVGGNAWNLSPGYEERLHRLVDELGLRDSVTFTGQVPDATPYIAAMDVLVNASEHEPFGIVLLEALALGVPVVAAASAGPTEIVEDGVSGFLVTGSDFKPASVLGRLLAHADLRDRVGREGQRQVVEKFAAGRMADQFENALSTLLAGEAKA
jgi:glycosyltransferase involved in cell wall biosynthesis